MKKHSLKPWGTAYATDADFCRIFAENMNNLYLLSLLLTADGAKAEQCFVSGLEDCSGTNRVFKEWAHSWAKRAIIQNAIRLVSPEPALADGDVSPAFSHDGKGLAAHPELPGMPAELSALLELQPFERFVFVISVLEGYPDLDCALLLGCTRQTLIRARIQALQQIGHSAEVGNEIRADLKAQNLADNRASRLKLAIAAG